MEHYLTLEHMNGSEVAAVSFGGRGQWLVAAGKDGGVTVFDLQNERQIYAGATGVSEGGLLHVYTDGQIVTAAKTGMFEGLARRYRLQDGVMLGEVEFGTVLYSVPSADGRLLVVRDPKRRKPHAKGFDVLDLNTLRMRGFAAPWSVLSHGCAAIADQGKVVCVTTERPTDGFVWTATGWFGASLKLAVAPRFHAAMSPSGDRIAFRQRGISVHERTGEIYNVSGWTSRFISDDVILVNDASQVGVHDLAQRRLRHFAPSRALSIGFAATDGGRIVAIGGEGEVRLYRAPG
jgi:hypothetical protein